ncbi:hypothetical protein AAMO2058_001223600 [Amorphochlora amoebiformis]
MEITRLTTHPQARVRASLRLPRGLRVSLICVSYAVFLVGVFVFGGNNEQSLQTAAFRTANTRVIQPRLATTIRSFPRCSTPRMQMRSNVIPEAENEVDESVSSEQEAKAKEIARLRAAEKFFRKGTGDFECVECQFVYKAENGDPESLIAKGTAFEDLPEDWLCPVCGQPKDTFEEQGKIVAGFAENQGYGFGTNSLTEGQKSALIYGSLAAFFALFLLGYKMN